MCWWIWVQYKDVMQSSCNFYCYFFCLSYLTNLSQKMNKLWCSIPGIPFRLPDPYWSIAELIQVWSMPAYWPMVHCYVPWYHLLVCGRRSRSRGRRKEEEKGGGEQAVPGNDLQWVVSSRWRQGVVWSADSRSHDAWERFQLISILNTQIKLLEQRGDHISAHGLVRTMGWYEPRIGMNRLGWPVGLKRGGHMFVSPKIL